MIEEWKPMVGYESSYSISNYGIAKRVSQRGPKSIFTEEDINNIKTLLNQGKTKVHIAKLYNCCRLTIQKLFDSKSIKNGGILKPSLRRDGYYFITPCINSKTKMVTVHSAVMAAFVGARPVGYEINHKDGNKINNRLDNLEYCTPSENSRHAKSVLNKRCKLSADNVKEIRDLLAGNISRKRIAETFSVSISVIDHIATGYSWSYV